MRLCLLCVGTSLVFGPVLGKSWRLYKVFTQRVPDKRVVSTQQLRWEGAGQTFHGGQTPASPKPVWDSRWNWHMTGMDATITGLVSHLAGRGPFIYSCTMRQELFHSTGKWVPYQAASSTVQSQPHHQAMFSFYIGHMPLLHYTPMFVFRSIFIPQKQSAVFVG